MENEGVTLKEEIKEEFEPVDTPEGYLDLVKEEFKFQESGRPSYPLENTDSQENNHIIYNGEENKEEPSKAQVKSEVQIFPKKTEVSTAYENVFHDIRAWTQMESSEEEVIPSLHDAEAHTSCYENFGREGTFCETDGAVSQGKQEFSGTLRQRTDSSRRNAVLDAVNRGHNSTIEKNVILQTEIGCPSNAVSVIKCNSQAHNELVLAEPTCQNMQSFKKGPIPVQSAYPVTLEMNCHENKIPAMAKTVLKPVMNASTSENTYPSNTIFVPFNQGTMQSSSGSEGAKQKGHENLDEPIFPLLTTSGIVQIPIRIDGTLPGVPNTFVQKVLIPSSLLNVNKQRSLKAKIILVNKGDLINSSVQYYIQKTSDSTSQKPEIVSMDQSCINTNQRIENSLNSVSVKEGFCETEDSPAYSSSVKSNANESNLVEPLNKILSPRKKDSQQKTPLTIYPKSNITSDVTSNVIMKGATSNATEIGWNSEITLNYSTAIKGVDANPTHFRSDSTNSRAKKLRPKRKRRKTLFFCKLCDYKSNDDSSIRTHLTFTHNRNREWFYCEHCPFKGKLKQSLRRHILHRHIFSSNKYKCRKCKFATPHRDNLIRHVKIHERIYPCKHCSFVGETRGSIYLHSKHSHVNMKSRYKCIRCPFTCSHTKIMLAHRKIEHSKDVIVFCCSRCEFKSKRKEEVLIHINRDHLKLDNPFKCPECKFKSSALETFKEHLYIKHNPYQKVLYCAHCAYKTTSKGRIFSHWNTKHNVHVKMHHCTLCTYAAKTKVLLDKHFNTCHNPEAVIYYCHHCDYSTKIKPKLGQHTQQKHIKKN